MKFRGIFSRTAPIILSLFPQQSAMGFQVISSRFGGKGLVTARAAARSHRAARSFLNSPLCPTLSVSKSTSRYMVTGSLGVDAPLSASTITAEDNNYMKIALDAAAKGVGNTYPNPAVGCVLVSSDSSSSEPQIIGTGFHPKAGYPHAEVFALLEACGYVDSGVESAKVVVECTKGVKATENNPIMERVDELLAQYSSTDGAKTLFDQKFAGQDVTAYVTLEPCCHYGKTPPCAVSLRMAGVNRVVVGFRDPNPKVDGGGVTVLQDQDVRVEIMKDGGSDNNGEMENAKACADIVSSFVKRKYSNVYDVNFQFSVLFCLTTHSISPRCLRTREGIAPRIDDENDGKTLADYGISMNGAKRSLLRSIAGRWKKDGTMTEFDWPSSHPSIDVESIKNDDDWEKAVGDLPIHHGWMESVDGALWDKEMILLRLNHAVAKKKGAKMLGERIANELGAHVAQVVGHTVLLYRPGRPPVLDLSAMLADNE